MLSYLNALEDRQFKTWCATVTPTCKVHLAKNLIYRDPPFVRNNFSPEVSNVIMISIGRHHLAIIPYKHNDKKELNL